MKETSTSSPTHRHILDRGKSLLRAAPQAELAALGRASDDDSHGLAGARPAALRVEIVRDLDHLAQHGEAWDALANAAPQSMPAMTYTWTAAWLAPKNDEWVCALAYEGDQLVGVLPAVVVPHRLLGRRFPHLRVQPNSDAVLATGRKTAVLRALLSALRKAEPGWLNLELRGVRQTSPTLVAVEHGLPGFVVERAHHSFGAFIRTTGAFQDFHAGLGAHFRANLRNASNRLAKLPAVEVVCLNDERTAAEGLARFMLLEASGWKGQQGTTLVQTSGLTAFYTTLVPRMASRGWLEWHFLKVDGQAIAGYLGVRCGRSLGLQKVAYDEAFGRCSPGHLLLAQLINRAFASEEIDEINLYTDFAWVQPWRPERSEYHTVWLSPRRPIPLLFGALPRRVERSTRRLLRPLVVWLRGRSPESRIEARREAPGARRLIQRARALLSRR